MEILFKSLSTISSIAVIFLAIYFKNLPKLLNDLTLENKKNKNQSNLQREAYFREISGAGIHKLLNDWMSMLADIENFNKKLKPATIIDMQSKTMMYGSEETVKVLSEMMKFIYESNMGNEAQGSNNSKNSKSEEFDLESAIGFYFVAKLVTSLKKDFTGYSVDPMMLIRTRVKHIDTGKNKEYLEKARIQVQEKLSK
ncbi:hypothetical protein [Streptococcus parauberis]|uniref:hypothetical protein n=1 Tax=Streptococcus parauberis TaxID=1348 RepID=UPI000E303DB8|nr:hypothetical protein [Streptococcus parauberis]RFE01177.1 hypothetical protein ADO06_02052 [Streptococcus parauberis]